MSVTVILENKNPTTKLKDIAPGECFLLGEEVFQRFNTKDPLAKDYFKPDTFNNKPWIQCFRLRDGYLNGYSPEDLVFKVDLEINVKVK